MHITVLINWIHHLLRIALPRTEQQQHAQTTLPKPLNHKRPKVLAVLTALVRLVTDNFR